ncbi:MAG: hypothetical protein WBF90_15595 [Rivularia sp. (in: cyanobacteria)]
MDKLAIQLTLHGAIVLLIGLLSGIPYGRAITKKQDEEIARAWRVAHSGLSMGGTTIIAVSAVISDLQLQPIISLILVYSFVVSGYGFCVALPYGAWVGHRGLSAKEPTQNRVVYAGNIVGAIGSTIGTILLIFGCIQSLV